MNAYSAPCKEFATNMAGMFSLPPISRLALAAALLVPSVATASELTPDQMAWYRAQMGLASVSTSPPSATNTVGDAVLEWRRLTQDQTASFDRLSRFLMANRDWPDADKMRVRAEKAIAIDSFDPARTLAYFQAFPPRTASGELRMALALNASGRRDEAYAAVRRAWTGGTLDEAEVSRVLSLFPGAISLADHDARMDKLLWLGATGPASRQLAFTSPDRRPIFAARLAMRSGAVDAAMQASAIEAQYPSLTRTDPGYIADKATWLRKAGRAALAAGDTAAANAHFADAAEHYDQFYGQLSLERLGRRQPKPVPVPTIRVSASEREAFDDDRLVRAARALGEIGAWREQSLFLRALAQRATTPTDHVLAGQLAASIGRPDLGVMIGRSAQANSLDAVEVSGFPTVRVPAGQESNWTFIHAITRQESQFDRQAISHAGARGMMQLMPGTAREVASKLGLGYDASSLTSDTNYNMTLGSTYFQQMLSYFGGSYPLAVAAYNAGPGNVNKWLRANGDPRSGTVDMIDWIEAIPIFETRNYVQRMLENAVVYDTLRDGDRSLPNAPLSFYLGKRTPG